MIGPDYSRFMHTRLMNTSFFIGLRYISTRQRNRSVSFISGIAMGGIVISVALLITVLSVMNGFDRELRNRILNILPQLTVYQSGGLQDWQGTRRDLLSASNRVTAVAPFVELQGLLNRGKQTKPALVFGVDASLEPGVSQISDFLLPATLTRLSASNSAIVLGEPLARELGVATGDVLTLITPQTGRGNRSARARQLQVIDVFATGTEVDRSLALMGLDGALEGSGQTVVTGLRVKVDDLFVAPQVAASLRQLLPAGFYTTDWTRSHGNLYSAIQMSKNLVTLLLVLIIAIAAFNVVSTLVMVVVDKQSDIAILRTLGLSGGEIMRVFMVQGSLIGVVGTLIGLLLGLALAFSIEGLVAGVESLLGQSLLTTEIYPISYLPSSVQPGEVLLICMVSVAMSFVATLYPSFKAARVQPARALRHE